MTSRPHRLPVRYSERENQAMGSLDWSQCSAVESLPDIRGGVWVFRNTACPSPRYLKIWKRARPSKKSSNNFMVRRKQIQAVLEFAARSLDPPPPAVGAVAPRDARRF